MFMTPRNSNSLSERVGMYEAFCSIGHGAFHHQSNNHAGSKLQVQEAPATKESKEPAGLARSQKLQIIASVLIANLMNWDANYIF